MGLKKHIRPIVQALAPCRKAVGCRAVNELVSRALFMVTVSYHKQRKKTSNFRWKHCLAIEFSIWRKISAGKGYVSSVEKAF